MDFYYGVATQIPGGVQIEIPDVPVCIVSGETWEEAYENAVDALAGCLADEERPGKSGRKAIAEEREGEIVPVPVDEKLIRQYETSRRVNISIPASVLKKIDEFRVRPEHRMTRSALLAQAATEFMESHLGTE